MAFNVARSGGRRSRHGRNADINVTPFVDVMLVLLIVFMITATQLDNTGVDIDLPKTDPVNLPSEEDPIRIAVDADGLIYLGGEETPITLDALTQQLTALADGGYEQRINIRGDGSADYANVMQVMARINVAGYTNIGLETEPNRQ